LTPPLFFYFNADVVSENGGAMQAQATGVLKMTPVACELIAK
jgi:hypothetical protein